MENFPKILVLDGGFTDKAQILVRCIRALGVFSLLVPANKNWEEIEKLKPKAIILVKGSVPISAEILGKIDLTLEAETLALPSEYENNNKIKIIWPQKFLDEPLLRALDKFLEVKKIEKTFKPKIVLKTLIQSVKEQVKDKKVLLAISGGVDSSVCAVLINKAIGKQLVSFLVDTGLMRLNEIENVLKLLNEELNINIVAIKAQNLFLDELKGVIEPEEKRKIIGRVFIEVFEEKAKMHEEFSFLAQGTIYPDIIESAVSAKGGAAVKSHHNVGGLPKEMNLELIEPLKYFYKDEVRILGLELGLPESLVFRQPFPGPGLAVRCVGEITNEKLAILRKADLIVREEIENANLKSNPWQYFAILLPVKSVGLCDNARNYGYACVLRAVESLDATTAEPSNLPFELLQKISKRLLKEEKDLARVLYDISSKPAATIEWE